MVSRFEVNVTTNDREEIQQVVYLGIEGEVLVLDAGVKPPEGFAEYKGDLKDLSPPKKDE